MIGWYESVVASDLRTPNRTGRLAKLLAYASPEHRDLDRALRLAQQAVEGSNRSPGLLSTLADVHYARGEMNEAIAVLDEAIGHMPEGVVARSDAIDRRDGWAAEAAP